MREATIRIPYGEFEELDGDGFFPLCREAGLQNLTELVCQSSGCLLVATVDSPLPEEDLSTLDGVEWWERLGTGDDGFVYLAKVRLPGHDTGVESLDERTVSNDDMRVTEDGIQVSLVGSQEGIAESIDDYERLGMTVVLQRIGDYDGPGTALDTLTARQREVVRTAFDLGYFDVPRGASTADVAAELDIDPSTVAEHLQRAEHNLLATLLGTQ